MEEPPEEAPWGLTDESTVKSSNDSYTNLQKDVDNEEADNQADHTTAIQADGGVSNQTEPKLSDQADHTISERSRHRPSDNVADHRAADKVDQGMSEGTDSKVSLQAGHVESEQIDRRLSSQSESTSEQSDHRLSMLYEQRASEQPDQRISGQIDQRTSEPVDRRLYGLDEQKTHPQDGHRLSNQIVYDTSVKTRHKVHDQVTELADLTDGSTHQPTVDKPDYRESDPSDHLINEENDDREGNQSNYRENDQYDDRTFTRKDRVQSYTVETHQTEHGDSKASLVNDTESTDFMKAFNLFDTKFISNLKAKGQGISSTFPTISTKLDYIMSQERTIQVTVANPDDISGREETSSHAQKQTHRKQFPSTIYHDPYQVALQYMEKHHILQIFQVQEMIKNRDQNATYKE